LVFSREGQIAEVEFHGLLANENVDRTLIVRPTFPEADGNL
jgi:hypothetical protein